MSSTDTQRPCPHIRSHLTTERLNLRDLARKVQFYPEGSPTWTRLMGKIEAARKGIAGLNESVQISGPKCSTCLERERASSTTEG